MKSHFNLHVRPVVLAVLFAIVSSIGLISNAHAESCLSNDSENDIMRCGATDRSNFITKLRTNTPGDLQAIYAQYGLSSSDYDRFASEAKSGKSDPNGTIIVNGTVIATGAHSLGRKEKKDSSGVVFSSPVTINGVTYHESPIGKVTKYQNDVMVLFDSNNEVQFVVMNLCGNPVRIDKKEAPKPKPKSSISIDKKVEDVNTKQVALNTAYTYTITIKNTGNTTLSPVTITDTPSQLITLTDSNGSGQIVNNAWTHTIDSMQPEETKVFTLTAKVPEYTNMQLTNKACVKAPSNLDTILSACDSAYVTVPKPAQVEVCVIATGKTKYVDQSAQYTSGYAAVDDAACHPVPTNKTVPKTGPSDVIVAMFGIGSLAGAGWYWRSGRRTFVSTMLGKHK